MSIQYVINGDLLVSSAHTLVNTVNCDGYMGKGLALQFKSCYPRCLAGYQAHCKARTLLPGKMQTCKEYLPEHLILNVSTKDHYWHPSRLEWVEHILKRIVANWAVLDMQSLAISKLGCGNGGLQWSDVGPLMVTYLSRLDAPISIYINTGDVQY